MRSESHPSFRKLWGRILEDLDAGDYIIQIHSMYDQSFFDGHKSLTLSTASALGGKNDLLGIAYLAFGGAVMIIACMFAVRGWIFRHPGDLHCD